MKQSKLLPDPLTEAALKYKTYEQLLALNAQIAAQALTPTLGIISTLPDLIKEKEKEKLIDKLRFENYLAFLEYEILIGFNSGERLHAHLSNVNICTLRFELIKQFSGVDILEATSLQEFIDNPAVQALTQNQEFQTKWNLHEILDQPKWFSFNNSD
jgi:hypothetical protein